MHRAVKKNYKLNLTVELNCIEIKIIELYI